MRLIQAVAATFLLFGSAHAADPIVTHSVAPADQGMVTACHEAIARWAAQFDPIDIDTTMTGPIEMRSGGDRMATLFVRIVYERQGGREPRSATIDCTVNADGSVVVAEAS